MERQSDGDDPISDGFDIPIQDLSMGDQVDAYLKVLQYDRLKHDFCDRYGYRLGETALALARLGARYGTPKGIIYDGLTMEELRQRYEQALETTRTQIPLNNRGRWMSEFLSGLNDVHKVALALDMH